MKNSFYQQLRMPLMVSLVLMVCFLSSCKKEVEVLTPTETPEKTWVLPQGNNAFDQRILNYYERFGTFILYKFTDQDIRWNVNKYDTNYKSVQANADYVNQQLDLLDKTFFKYYSDATLKKYLPIKMFLCSSLRLGSTTKEINAYLLTPTTEAGTISAIALGGYQSFAVNWGRKAIVNINNPIDSTIIFKNDVNFSFLKMNDLLGNITRSEDFLNTSDYTTALVATTTTERYKRGFIGVAGAIPTPQSDYFAFIRAITSTHYTDLTNPTTGATDATYKGILNSLKDPNGLIKKKYNLLVNHYQLMYGIDIQKIGNGG